MCCAPFEVLRLGLQVIFTLEATQHSERHSKAPSALATVPMLGAFFVPTKTTLKRSRHGNGSRCGVFHALWSCLPAAVLQSTIICLVTLAHTVHNRVACCLPNVRRPRRLNVVLSPLFLQVQPVRRCTTFWTPVHEAESTVIYWIEPSNSSTSRCA